jgi:serine/threonine-protein kinase
MPDLLADLVRFHLVDADRLAAVPSERPAVVVRRLVADGVLSPFQAEAVLAGKANTLLLGSYVLLDLLGEGGMGAVYRARNWKLGSVVAVKVIRPERVSGSTALRRFQREIRAAAQLDHPNVVRAVDADEVAGTPMLVMEFVEGTDLAKIVAENGPLPPALACEYAAQVADGLQHAHERGLVHRDIKPHNLILTRKPDAAGRPVVKVFDFGLARLFDADAGESSGTLTQDHTILGTPDFMAPEQVTGSHAVDIRADLYSLGCTLYFLLTGRPPFPDRTATNKLLAHKLEEPEPLDRVKPGTPAGVAAAVRTLMAKQPEHRYPTPAAAAAALRAAPYQAAPTRTGSSETRAAFDSLLDAPSTPAFRPPPRTRVNGWLVAAGAGVLLLPTVAAVWVLTPPPASDPAPPTRPAPPPLAVNAPQRWKDMPNLLEHFDPSRLARNGDWEDVPNGGVRVGSRPAAWIAVPYRPPAEYDVRLEFTREDGSNGVGLLFPRPGDAAQETLFFALGGNNDAHVGLEAVNGEVIGGDNPSRIEANWIGDRKKHELVFSVRKTGARALLDGTSKWEFKTDWGNTSGLGPWKRPDDAAGYIGLGAWSSSTTFHRLQVLPASDAKPRP